MASHILLVNNLVTLVVVIFSSLLAFLLLYLFASFWPHLFRFESQALGSNAGTVLALHASGVRRPDTRRCFLYHIPCAGTTQTCQSAPTCLIVVSSCIVVSLYLSC